MWKKIYAFFVDLLYFIIFVRGNETHEDDVGVEGNIAPHLSLFLLFYKPNDQRRGDNQAD